jgi:uncharacterized membrane protein YraQ (UPF0718 family)
MVGEGSKRGKRRAIDGAFLVIITLSLAAALIVWRREGWTGVEAILIEDLKLFGAVLPKVAAGCMIGALVRILIPQSVIVRWLGEGSGLRGLALAALVGGLFPGGPFTIFPLAAALMLSGADRGTTTAFVTAWLLIGLNRAVIWELPFMGADLTLARNLLSLPLPILAGAMARAVSHMAGPDKTGDPA